MTSFPTIPGGRYTIEGRLGSGGYGEVFRGTQVQIGRPVAIKLLHPHLAERATVIRRFQREARLLSRIRHTNIVSVFDFHAESGLLYLVMEFLEGPTLRQWARSHAPLSCRSVAEIGMRIAGGLHAVHNGELIHRDLKPSNIIMARLQGSLEPVLIDFGLAASAEAEDDETVLTASEQVLGTPLYISPEVARGQAAGPASDVYALGVMLHELVAGKVPLRGNHIMETLRLHAWAPAPPLVSARGETLPKPFTDLVAACLEKEASARPSLDVVTERLGRLVGSGSSLSTFALERQAVENESAAHEVTEAREDDAAPKKPIGAAGLLNPQESQGRTTLLSLEAVGAIVREVAGPQPERPRGAAARTAAQGETTPLGELSGTPGSPPTQQKPATSVRPAQGETTPLGVDDSTAGSADGAGVEAAFAGHSLASGPGQGLTTPLAAEAGDGADPSRGRAQGLTTPLGAESDPAGIGFAPNGTATAAEENGGHGSSTPATSGDGQSGQDSQEASLLATIAPVGEAAALSMVVGDRTAGGLLRPSSKTDDDASAADPRPEGTDQGGGPGQAAAHRSGSQPDGAEEVDVIAEKGEGTREEDRGRGRRVLAIALAAAAVVVAGVFLVAPWEGEADADAFVDQSEAPAAASAEGSSVVLMEDQQPGEVGEADSALNEGDRIAGALIREGLATDEGRLSADSPGDEVEASALRDEEPTGGPVEGETPAEGPAAGAVDSTPTAVAETDAAEADSPGATALGDAAPEERPPQRSRERRPRAERSAPAQAVEDGVLTVNINPWGDAYLDGRALGRTPIRGISLQPGRYVVVTRHGEDEQRETVTIRSGERTNVLHVYR